MFKDYWNYYSKDYSWNEPAEFCNPDLNFTLTTFQASGFSKIESLQLVESGYVIIKGYEKIVIDRYYGGLLNSFDYKTRIPLKDFREWLQDGSNRVKTYEATSYTNLNELISQIKFENTSSLLFRGQSTNYKVKRTIPNPNFLVGDLGEISLIPSLWREMLKKNQHSYSGFNSLSNWEWQKIVDTQFNMEEVKEKWNILNQKRGFPANLFDLEDSEDPTLQEYGKFHSDLTMGAQFNLADTLSTYLQHYGLLSPVLDLTSDLDVALYFATYKFLKNDNKCEYKFIGTNNQQSLIYILKHSAKEMKSHADKRFIQKINPLRPVRQSCVISKTAPFAINLPADFLVGVISLKFDLKESLTYETNDLFPDSDTDLFLKSLKKSLLMPKLVTDFN